jgi:hypothetical protein
MREIAIKDTSRKSEMVGGVLMGLGGASIRMLTECLACEQEEVKRA